MLKWFYIHKVVESIDINTSTDAASSVGEAVRPMSS